MTSQLGSPSSDCFEKYKLDMVNHTTLTIYIFRFNLITRIWTGQSALLESSLFIYDISFNLYFYLRVTFKMPFRYIVNTLDGLFVVHFYLFSTNEYLWHLRNVSTRSACAVRAS